MIAINSMFGDVVDDDALARLANFVANCGAEYQLFAKLETESDSIEHGAGDPTSFRYSGDSGKSPARHIQMTWRIDGTASMQLIAEISLRELWLGSFTIGSVWAFHPRMI